MFHIAHKLWFSDSCHRWLRHRPLHHIIYVSVSPCLRLRHGMTPDGLHHGITDAPYRVAIPTGDGASFYFQSGLIHRDYVVVRLARLEVRGDGIAVRVGLPVDAYGHGQRMADQVLRQQDERVGACSRVVGVIAIGNVPIIH